MKDWLTAFVSNDLLLIVSVMVPAVLLLELARPAQSIAGSHYRFDAALCATNTIVFVALSPLIAAATAVIAARLGLGLIDMTALGFGGVAGALLAMLVATMITDFFQYWFHRLLHENRALWQIHVLHHSDEHMNVTTAQRSHVFELLLTPIFITLPMALLFKLPPVTIATVSLIPYAYLFFTHANLRVGYGPFWWLLVSPDYHRIHHSIETQHRDKNFANWFPIWDIVFGTSWKPGPGENPRMGVTGVEISTLPAAYLHPLRGWKRMLTQKVQAQGQPMGETVSAKSSSGRRDAQKRSRKRRR